MAATLSGWKQARRWACWAATACVLICLTVPVYAQKNNAAQKVSPAEDILIQKAQSLEARGRPDLAAQVWQQILLSDPNNPQALEGVARSFRMSGNAAASSAAIEKLRKLNPNDPNIKKLESLHSNRAQDERLSLAGKLA